jgi:hypothetical protein
LSLTDTGRPDQCYQANLWLFLSIGFMPTSKAVPQHKDSPVSKCRAVLSNRTNWKDHFSTVLPNCP